MVLDARADDLDWTSAYGDRVAVVTGDAGEDEVAQQAAAWAARSAGWRLGQQRGGVPGRLAARGRWRSDR